MSEFNQRLDSRLVVLSIQALQGGMSLGDRIEAAKLSIPWLQHCCRQTAKDIAVNTWALHRAAGSDWPMSTDDQKIAGQMAYLHRRLEMMMDALAWAEDEAGVPRTYPR